MKEIMAINVVLIVVATALMPTLVLEGEATALNGVDVSWKGRQLVITNNNDYSIYNLSLHDCTISGFIVCGWIVVYDPTVSELPAGARCSFSLGTGMVFGFGPGTLTVTVSYQEQGEQIKQEATTKLFLLGPLVFFTR